MAKTIFGLLFLIANITWANQVESPAGKRAKSSGLEVIGDNLYLFWVEQSPSPQILISRLDKTRFAKPNIVAQPSNLASNWADSGRLFSLSNGEAYYWWPEKMSPGENGYNLMLTKSIDQLKTWHPLGKINQDSSATEHGFASLVEDGGRLRIAWVDGRDTLQGGASALRSVILSENQSEELLDTRVCDCCGTSAVAVKDNILIFYRGRSSEDQRDIQIVKRIDRKWRAPTSLNVDKWKLSGCPMNGPHASSRGNFVIAGWFTKAFDKSLTKIKISNDGGLSFQRPIVIDDSKDLNLGRVGTDMINEKEAVVSWVRLIPETERAQLLARKVSSEGKLGNPVVVSEISSSKASGFPMTKVFKDEVYFTWTEPNAGIKIEKIPLTKF